MIRWPSAQDNGRGPPERAQISKIFSTQEVSGYHGVTHEWKAKEVMEKGASGVGRAARVWPLGTVYEKCPMAEMA
jgi:hypothetical protein